MGGRGRAKEAEFDLTKMATELEAICDGLEHRSTKNTDAVFSAKQKIKNRRLDAQLMCPPFRISADRRSDYLLLLGPPLSLLLGRSAWSQ